MTHSACSASAKPPTALAGCALKGRRCMPLGFSMAMGVTEVNPREFVQTEDGKGAWERELREMSARRLDFEKPVFN